MILSGYCTLCGPLVQVQFYLPLKNKQAVSDSEVLNIHPLPYFSLSDGNKTDLSFCKNMNQVSGVLGMCQKNTFSIPFPFLMQKSY